MMTEKSIFERPEAKKLFSLIKRTAAIAVETISPAPELTPIKVEARPLYKGIYHRLPGYRYL